MTERASEQEKKHAISLLARKTVSISGVTQVESFDDRTVQLVTDCGELTLEGDGLQVGTLDIATGRVEVQGSVSGLFYSDGGTVKKGRRRLFG